MARRILLTGVQGSGKSRLLAELTRLKVQCTPIEGSSVIQQLLGAKKLHSFDELPKKQRNEIRRKAADHLMECSKRRAHPLIVDGHLALRNQSTGIIETVWNEHDQKLYSEVIFLDLDPEIILHRRENDLGGKLRKLSLAEIQDEVNAERQQVQNLPAELPVFLLKERNLTAATQRLEQILTPGRRKESPPNSPSWLNDAEANKRAMLAHLRSIDLGDKKVIVLLDADRTLTPLDTSYELIAKIESLSWGRFCSGYKYYGYVFEAFREAILEISSCSIDKYTDICRKLAKEVPLYDAAIELLQKLDSGPSQSIIVTCGSPALWREFLKGIGCFNTLVFGGLHYELDLFLIGKEEKGMLAKQLRRRGHIVVAIGDSEVDELMLREANLPVIAENYKENRDLLPGLQNTPGIKKWFQAGKSQGASTMPPITVTQIIDYLEVAYE